ncbi:MAG TPA: hypothetical protein PLF22_02065 [Pseudomonadales bacterium]|nr:hypothetical protein [Pseudomonadales bacterium]
MKNAVELLDVISASSLPVAENLEQQRDGIVARIDAQLNAAGASADSVADSVARLLVNEGVVMTDTQSVRDVVAEYLHVIDDEQAALGDEEMDFLENFLK